MLNLAFALIPSLGPDRRNAEEGFLGKLVLRARQRIRYHRALHELQRLDDRDLDDITSRGWISPSWRGGTRPAPSPSSGRGGGS